MKNTQAYISENKDRFLDELIELLKIPSISADSAYDGDMVQTAEFIKEKLDDAGVQHTKIYETAGHPIVYGEHIVDPALPTVLVYGHYDVQPPDPLELWDSPPFEPVIKKTDLHPAGAIFARGACDDKGQVYMHVAAFQAMHAADNIACNIKFMLEGEEEVGSVNLEEFCRAHADMLACDVVLLSDTSIIDNDTPSITVGLRGLSYVEVEVHGPNKDLHSGVYGGAVVNPVNVLSQMITQLKNDQGKINIPGFYDDVEELSEAERTSMSQAPFDEALYKEQLGIEEVDGEVGYTTRERASIRPTLDVNGMWGGYTGEGAKTVLPSKAFAKISMRLVPFQDPDKVTKQFEDYFKSIAPKGVKVIVKPHHGGYPAVTPIDTVEYKAASLALNETFGKEAIPVRSGGSIPIVSMFEDVFGVKSVMMGFGLNTDDIHSPNEHFGLFNFYRGIETIPHFYEQYRKLKQG